VCCEQSGALVATESVGRPADEAYRRHKAKVAIARKLAVILHCIWTMAPNSGGREAATPNRSSTPEFARAETLSLPGRQVEMTAHHALFADTTIIGQFASSHCASLPL